MTEMRETCGKSSLSVFWGTSRRLFLLGAIYASVVALIWVPWFLGIISLPTEVPPKAWYLHEVVFGYGMAATAGFILMAVTSGSERMPAPRALLLILVLLWIAGRGVMAISLMVPFEVALIASLAFLACLTGFVGWRVAAGRDRQNLDLFVLLLGALAIQVGFHWETLTYGRAILSDRLTVALAVISVLVLGSRMTEDKAGQWLTTVTLCVSGAGLIGWAMAPLGFSAGLAAGLLLASVALILISTVPRSLSRGRGDASSALLGLAYLFVVLGPVFAGWGLLTGNLSAGLAANQAWIVGAVPALSLSVMTYAIQSCTDEMRRSFLGSSVIWLCIGIAGAAAIALALQPQWTMLLVPASGIFMAAAFLSFVFVHRASLRVAQY